MIETELVDDEADQSADEFTFPAGQFAAEPSTGRKPRQNFASSGLQNLGYVALPLGVLGFLWFAISEISWMAQQPSAESIMSHPGIGWRLALLIAGSVVLYLAPCLIASRRKCHNCAALVSANILLGWTLIGWTLVLLFAQTFERAGKKKAAWRRQQPDTPYGTFVYTCFAFDGRIPRSVFWLSLIAVHVFVGVTIALILPLIHRAGQFLPIGFLALMVCLGLHMSLAVQVKRWHDRDRRAYWMLCNNIPLLGIFFAIWSLIETGFLRGTWGDNRFGPDPLA